MLAHAQAHGIGILSVATRQRLAGPLDGVLHPSLLTTLVYRFGRPNCVSRTPSRVQANGQCCLVRVDLLDHMGGFASLSVRASLCEDVTLARMAARVGHRVGFYEADGLVDVTMYPNWRELWRNWPRSLTTRDAAFGLQGWLGLLEVLLVQALPAPLMLMLFRKRRARGATRALVTLNAALLGMRLGVLIGTARAYPMRPWTYWLPPIADLPVAIALWRSALRRRHTWRGRAYVRTSGRIATSA